MPARSSPAAKVRPRKSSRLWQPAVSRSRATRRRWASCCNRCSSSWRGRTLDGRARDGAILVRGRRDHLRQYLVVGRQRARNRGGLPQPVAVGAPVWHLLECVLAHSPLLVSAGGGLLAHIGVEDLLVEP